MLDPRAEKPMRLACSVVDVLARYLVWVGQKLTYVRNVTDIDDKINKAAIDGGEDIATLADRYTEAYEEDIDALGVLKPLVVPRATHHIPEIIAMIEVRTSNA